MVKDYLGNLVVLGTRRLQRQRARTLLSVPASTEVTNKPRVEEIGWISLDFQAFSWFFHGFSWVFGAFSVLFDRRRVLFHEVEQPDGSLGGHDADDPGEAHGLDLVAVHAE